MTGILNPLRPLQPRLRQAATGPDNPCTDEETLRLGLWPIFPPPDSPKPKIGRRSVVETSAWIADYDTKQGRADG